MTRLQRELFTRERENDGCLLIPFWLSDFKLDHDSADQCGSDQGRTTDILVRLLSIACHDFLRGTFPLSPRDGQSLPSLQVSLQSSKSVMLGPPHAAGSPKAQKGAQSDILAILNSGNGLMCSYRFSKPC